MTIGVTLAGVLYPITAICYILMQIVGGVTGTAIASVSTCVFVSMTQGSVSMIAKCLQPTYKAQ